MGSGREIEFMKRGVRRRRRRIIKHMPAPMAVMTIPTARNTPATAAVFAKKLHWKMSDEEMYSQEDKAYPDLGELSSIPHIPVGFAMTCVTLTRCPSGCVDTLTLVNTGGSESVVWF